MKLSYEYNEYVVGFVVKDEKSGRCVNFQFDDFKRSLNFGCEADDTYQVFTEDELATISEFLSSKKDAEEFISMMKEVFRSDEKKAEYFQLLSKNGCVQIWEIESLLAAEEA